MALVPEPDRKTDIGHCTPISVIVPRG